MTNIPVLYPSVRVACTGRMEKWRCARDVISCLIATFTGNSSFPNKLGDNFLPQIILVHPFQIDSCFNVPKFPQSHLLSPIHFLLQFQANGSTLTHSTSQEIHPSPLFRIYFSQFISRRLRLVSVVRNRVWHRRYILEAQFYLPSTEDR